MIVKPFLELQAQVKVLHWHTKSYPEHKALGKLYETLDELIDSFVETHSGKYGNTVAKDRFTLEVMNYRDTSPDEVFDHATDFLTKELPAQIAPEDTDLLNIRDEMLAAINRTRYLLRLK